MGRAASLRIVPALAIALGLAACGGGSDDVAALDNELVGTNAVDPAMMSALQDQIMVDPNLAQQANGDAVRPPDRPYTGATPPDTVAANTDQVADGQLMRAPAPTPVEKCNQCQVARQSITLGALAERQTNRRTSGCAANLNYSTQWATRLPADLPLYPQARVTEAAGTDGGACKLRVVSFSSPKPMQHMLDWYYTKAVRGGYSAEHQSDGAQHILGGTRARDDAAYVVFMTARQDGGTDIDLVANNGV